MKKVHIKDICTKGSSALKQKDLLENGDYPVYGASGIAGYLNEYHQDKEYIAVVKDGSGIGRVSFQEPQSSVIGTMQYILPKEGYNIRYIGYCLQSLDLAGYKQGAAIPHIYFRDYGERLVNVTDDKAEQQAIVSRLDSAFAKIDALKANAEREIQEAKSLFQKALSKAMTPKEGWEEKKLGEVSIISGDYGLSVSSKPFDGIRYIRITDITEYGELNDDKVSAQVDENIKQEKLKDGDILFARTGATVGKTLIYNERYGDCLFAGYLIRYRLDKNIVLPQFMYYVTHSSEYYEWVNVSQEAAAQPNISAKKYNLLPISIPPLSEQQAIVTHLDILSEKLKTVEERQKAIMAECDAMKQALLREVFA